MAGNTSSAENNSCHIRLPENKALYCSRTSRFSRRLFSAPFSWPMGWRFAIANKNPWVWRLSRHVSLGFLNTGDVAMCGYSETCHVTTTLLASNHRNEHHVLCCWLFVWIQPKFRLIWIGSTSNASVVCVFFSSRNMGWKLVFLKWKLLKLRGARSGHHVLKTNQQFAVLEVL